MSAPPDIDRYDILELLGEGGMSSVYLAEQREPIRRQVALKMLKQHLGMPDAEARFLAERDTLARREHPNIAAIYDTGVSRDGRAYFAMEAVLGEDLLSHCDGNRLAVDARLRLVATAARALQYAHIRGVIHRDVKPSNLLVSRSTGGDQLKVIDFGIAKLLADAPIGRATAPLLGTLLYMSPEQVTGGIIDTRADVYALGLVLYELLCGALPFDDVDNAAVLPYLIQQQTPPRLVDRFASLGARRETVAAQRRVTVDELARQLGGDLEWIVAQAIARDPADRYQSMADLAEDLDAFLAIRPVAARPPSTLYVLRRFARRNRAAVSFAAAALLAAGVGVTATAYGFVQAERARDLAEREAASARQVTDFLVGLFNRADPTGRDAGQLTVPELLATAAESIEEQALEDPDIRARLETTVGRVFLNLGQADKALDLADAALTRLPAEAADTRSNASALAVDALIELGRFAAGLERLKGALAERGQAPRTEDLRRRALARYGLNDFRGALDDLLAAHEQLARDPNGDPAGFAELALQIGVLFSELDDLDRSMEWQRLSIERLDKLYGAVHPATAMARQNYAINLRKLGRYDEAVAIYGKVLEAFRGIYRGDHPNIANTLNNRALALARAGDVEEALVQGEASLARYRRIFGADHTKVAIVMNNLGRFHRMQGRHDEAVRLQTEALALQRRHLPPDSVGLASIEVALARSLLDAGRPADALEQLEPAVTKLVNELGEQASDVLLARAFLAEALLRTDRRARARPLLESSLPKLRDVQTVEPQLIERWERLLAGVAPTG